MRTTQQIRIANLLLLLKECEEESIKTSGSPRGAAAELARKSGVKPAYISQLRNSVKNPSGKPRTIGNDSARKLERGMDKPEGWMDQDHGPARNMNEADWLDAIRILTPAQREALLTTASQFAELNASAVAHGIPIAAPKTKRPPRPH